MLKLATSVFLICLSPLTNAQGSWNIGYIQADSITQEHVGQVVRIDFKSLNISFSTNDLRRLRSYVGTKDTGTITIDKTLLVLVERRKIYVDHGNYNDQFLECINCNDRAMLIYDAKILEVDAKSIQFQLDIETKMTGAVNQKETKILRIYRSKLDGVMYKL